MTSPLLRASQSKDPWAEASSILSRIKPPTFPTRDFNITQFGAAAGADSSDAITKAIAACSAAGGGRVIIPAGEFLTGPIRLKSGVNLTTGGASAFRLRTSLSATAR